MIRTIKIDTDAYDRLDDARRHGESLSEVIKRCVRKKRSLDEVARLLEQSELSSKTLDAIDESATRRRRTPRRRRA
jgi:predicted CopG family antitoxin